MVADGVPRFTELMNPTLEAIRSSGGSASIKEITLRVVDIMNLSPEKSKFLTEWKSDEIGI